MDIKTIAEKLVAYCRVGDFAGAQAELYSTDAESFEPSGWGPEHTVGLDAIKAKGEQFQSGIEEVHSITVSDPIIANETFAITIAMDTTMKGQPRMNMLELCIYTVKDGKIVKEQFLA
jgi:hypothetical protein